MQSLAEKELVGLVDWAAADVCRYHYFRHRWSEGVIREGIRREQRYDKAKPYGQRTEDRAVKEKVVQQEQFKERHIHHIVGAKMHPLAEYPQPVPKHVRVFIDSVPQWLRPHLRIVEGTITTEEVLERKVSSETVVKSEVLSVSKYSPGILFGEFNLIGWSADDLKKGATPLKRKVVTTLRSALRVDEAGFWSLLALALLL